MSNQDTAISVKNVSKNFILPHQKKTSLKSLFTGVLESKGNEEIQHALQNISFDIKKGEFFGIVGRNGSGKSTLLKIISGIYQPTKGTIKTEGRLVPFIELGVGFNPELTGRENVYLNGAMLGFSKKHVDSNYDKIVEFAELERFMDQKLKNYSSGMQVRLAFACATMANADILVVDEVLAVGDADFQRKCFDYFKSLKKNNTTVVFVSHDMNAVREFCDRAVLIEKSKLVKEGTSEDIAKEYAKLFMDQSSNTDPEGNRLGNGDARISSVKITQDKNTVNVEYKITFNKDIESPVVGYLFKDASENPLFGTNTQLMEMKLKDYRAGEKAKISWEVPHIFGDGKFYVTLAVSGPNGLEYDWLENASSFVVKRSQKSPYAIDPIPEIDIK